MVLPRFLLETILETIYNIYMENELKLERPPNLREDVWLFLLAAIEAIPKQNLSASLEAIGYKVHERDPQEKLIEEVVHESSRFLEHAGILKRPELIEGMIIELDNDIDYLIDGPAARAIAGGDELIQLSRLGETQQKYAINRSRIIEAMRSGTSIDYFEDYFEERRVPSTTRDRR